MPLVFPSLALPLLPGPRPLLPGSSLSRPPAFAYRVLLAADILSLSLSLSLFYPPFRFPSIYFTLYLRSLSGTRHTGTPGKSVAHRYLIISIGPSSVLLKTTRFAQGSRPGLRSPPPPTPSHPRPSNSLPLRRFNLLSFIIFICRLNATLRRVRLLR